MLFSVPMRPWMRRILPTSIWNYVNLTVYGWEFHEKLRPFQEYAAPQGNPKSYLLAGCGTLEFWTCDPEVAHEILRRPRDFHQHHLTGLFMGVFGHNILTDNGDQWARQRKIVASVITERISKSVFEESVRQTRGMIQEVLSAAPSSPQPEASSATSNNLFDMIKKITIHVLSGAGMGANVPWKNEDGEKPPPGYKMTYIESAKVVMESVTGPIILPPLLLAWWPSWFPGYKKMQQLGIAKREFPKHTELLLDEERQRTSDKSIGRSNIMSQMIQASEQDPGAEKAVTLSQEEMIGNLFIFTAAGFETTANSLSYALALLAKYPKWQDWLIEEVDGILPDKEQQELSYTAVHPRATRILAFMFETLRLYTPVVHLTKENITPQTIPTSRGPICLPAGTSIYIDNIALHLDAEVWRDLNRGSDPDFVRNSATTTTLDDEFVFRPSRWLNAPGSPQPHFQPPRGAFIPWSAGPRVCPGQKMAQVEFAAVLLTLLHRHRVEAAPAFAGETQQQVEDRLEAQLNDSMSILTLQMNGVYDAGEKGGLPMRLSQRV
ncbi:hypothetical protein SLS62_006765 [Diatrype stigma]|uniref:Cytochrome P450 n=1 Tax=Diatrype stigma TaxID=117547 RepID=A0AAN9YRB5_9PEZI